MMFPPAALALSTARMAAAVAGATPASIERIRLKRLEEDARAARLAEKKRVQQSEIAVVIVIAFVGLGSCALVLFS